MAIDIIFGVFITDEYNIENDVTDNINNYKEFRKSGMIYNVCEFIIVDHNIPMKLSGDGKLRVRVERSIDGVPFSDLFIIDDMKVNHLGQISATCKTVGALLFEPYTRPATATFNFPTYNEIFELLLGDIVNTSLLPPIPNSTYFYNIENETYGSVIIGLAEKLGVDLYIKNGAVILEPMKTISASSTPVVSFGQGDVFSASVSNKDASGLGIISINITNADVVSEASMALSIAYEPQPVRPEVVKIWLDPQTNDIYTIEPQECKVVLFSNPTDIGYPAVRGLDFNELHDHAHVEEWEMLDETCVNTLGGITEILGVTITNGTENSVTGVANTQYYSGTDGSDMLLFEAVPTDDLADGNGIEITFEDSVIDEPISSTMSGTGTDADPYIYDLVLGAVENVPSAFSICAVKIYSMYSFSEIIETLTLTSKTAESTLNGHIIKVDATGAIQTSGYAYSAGETVFYFDPNKVYDSIAIEVFREIVTATTLPYTAILDTWQTDVELRARVEVQTCGVFAGGADEVYAGQRDAMAISNFVRTDPNADGIITVSDSVDTSNPTEVPTSIITDGGIGYSSSLDQSTGQAGVNLNYKKYHNVICADRPITGTLRVMYSTKVLWSMIPNQEYEKNMLIEAVHVDSTIRHNHEVRAIDYFPLSYIYRLDLSEEWGLEPRVAQYKYIYLYTVDNYSGLETLIFRLQSDATGIIMLNLGVHGYGQYALKANDIVTTYIRYYANKYDVSKDVIIIKEADSGLCP